MFEYETFIHTCNTIVNGLFIFNFFNSSYWRSLGGGLMDIYVKEILGSCEVNIIDLCLATLFAKVAI